MEEVRFELLENGLDFIPSGLDYIARGETKSDLKYGILHLSAGIELVLKARLQKEDWKLLFPNPERAKENRYKSGDFWSIGFDTVLSRLEEDCAIELSTEGTERLRAIRARRNRLEHFAIVDTKSAIESVAAQALAVVIDFIGEAFEGDALTEEENDLILHVRERLKEFEVFRTERIAKIFADSNPRRTELTDALQCPSCLNETLVPDVSVECLFCGYRASAEDSANFFLAQHHAARAIYYCPGCENEALVDIGAAGNMAPATQFFCFACGGQWDEGTLEECPFCQQLEYPDFMSTMGCRECFGAYVAEDHT